MKIARPLLTLLAACTLCAAWAALVLGCRSGGQDTGAVSASGAAQAEPEEDSELSGSELWSQNCARCHNMRSPTTYDDAQWRVVVMHMRVIGGLTGAEERKILEFLRASN